MAAHFEDVSARDILVDQSHGKVVVHGSATIVVVDSSHALVPPGRTPADPGLRNPYKGLAAFQEADVDDFFGRERLVRRLHVAFHALHTRDPQGSLPTRILPILGPSGSGKSSVARAGLIPQLARQPIGPEESRIAVLTPGAHPVESLDAALAAVGGDGRGRTVLLVDQFEEVYTRSADGAEREEFVERLLALASEPHGSTSIVLTLRTDFVEATSSSERLSRVIAEQGVMVPVLSREELRSAVADPARRAGLVIDDATVELLVAESRGREGVLPLLQFALTRIWDGLRRGVPAAETFRAIGGVGGALASAAEALYGGLASDVDRGVARRVFLRMVQVSRDAAVPATRRRVAVEDLATPAVGEERVRAVLERFADPAARVVTFSAAADGTEAVEITHEALLEHWSDLRGWIEEDRGDLVFHDWLAAAVDHWSRNGRHHNLLWRPPDLDALRRFRARRGDELSSPEEAFYRASEGSHRVRRSVQVGVPLGLVALLGGAALWSRMDDPPPVVATDAPKESVRSPSPSAPVVLPAVDDSTVQRMVRGPAPRGGSRTGRRALECAVKELARGARETEANGGPWVRKYLAPTGFSGNLPWQVAFVSWCFSQAADPLPFSYTATGRALLDEFRSKGWLYEPTPARPPQPGDVAFWRVEGTTGTVVGIVHHADTLLYTVVGNSKNRVRGSVHAIRDPRLLGYGRVPDPANSAGDAAPGEFIVELAPSDEPVRLSVRITDGQPGRSLASLDGRTLGTVGEEPLELGRSAELIGRVLVVTTSVVDVNPSNGRVGAEYRVATAAKTWDAARSGSAPTGGVATLTLTVRFTSPGE